MKKYEELEVAVIPFTEEDVITTSGGEPEPCGKVLICCDGTVEIVCQTKGISDCPTKDCSVNCKLVG